MPSLLKPIILENIHTHPIHSIYLFRIFTYDSTTFAADGEVEGSNTEESMASDEGIPMNSQEIEEYEGEEEATTATGTAANPPLIPDDDTVILRKM